VTEILVLYYSRFGSTRALARHVATGIDSIAGAAARLRTVPAVTSEAEHAASEVPDSGPPYVVKQDLRDCAGLLLGSPTRFGNMAAPLKYFLDSSGDEWMRGTLSGKPAGVFTSTSSLHGGQESTLISMALPLLHHGMLWVGIPYSEPQLAATTTGGSPYGATHVTWNDNDRELSDDEVALAVAHGARVARIARKLA